MITQEDYWTVISSFFHEKGLVRQQLDSFDEFIQNTMQELIDENSELVLDQNSQYTGVGSSDDAVCVAPRTPCVQVPSIGANLYENRAEAHYHPVRANVPIQSNRHRARRYRQSYLPSRGASS